MGCCFSSSEGGGGGRDRGGSGGGRGDEVATESHEMEIYNSIEYLSESTVIRNPNQIVSQVHFVAQTRLRNGGNHWVIFLQTGPESAVRINMDPGDVLGSRLPGHGYRGCIGIINRDCIITKNREGYVTATATPGHSVANFIDAIIRARNHEYDFTTAGRGCTGWIVDQYRLFLGLGLIQLGPDDIEGAIGREWVNSNPGREWQVTHGFYMKNTRRGAWSSSGGNGRGGGESSRSGNEAERSGKGSRR